ncbi:MAG: pyruvate, water dikinase regulatory protein [Thermincolia bacterium]
MVYVVSDSIGETAEFVVRAAVSQFNSHKVEIRRIPYVNDPEVLSEIIEESKGRTSIIAYTLVEPDLRSKLLDEAEKARVRAVDIMGPMIDALATIVDKAPKLQPGLLYQLDEEYFRKVEAIEFAVKYDDGKDPRGMRYADIVIIGVSRSSKTPLCMYLAHKRIKAANVPLVPEVAPPEELFKLTPRKVIGLTCRPQQLNIIRQERLKTLGLTSGADYASLERILKELEYAEQIMKRIGCPVIDVTNKAVEETASRVLEIYYKGDRTRHGK